MVFLAAKEQASVSEISNYGLQAPGDGLCPERN